MRFLITGGCGFLGSHLGDALLGLGHEVAALDPSPPGKVAHNLDHPRFRYVRASVTDRAALEAEVRRADVVYHLGAVVGVEHYVEDPLRVLDVNVNGTQVVLSLAHAHGLRVVFASTSEVYGRNPAVPFREDSDRVLGPASVDRWCYSTSKAAGEHFCFAWARRGLPVIVLRYFNAYGPRLDRPDAGRILTIFLGQLLRGEALTVVGDGRQTRCFTYVDDAIAATVAAGTLPGLAGGAFNVGTDVETTILELAETMRDEFAAQTGRRPSGIRFVTAESVYGNSYEDIPRRVPDITRMRDLLGVTPRVGLRDGIRRTIAWFLAEDGASPADAPDAARGPVGRSAAGPGARAHAIPRGAR